MARTKGNVRSEGKETLSIGTGPRKPYIPAQLQYYLRDGRPTIYGKSE